MKILNNFKRLVLNIKTIYWSYGFLLVNLILKFLYLRYPDVSLDEPFTVFHSQQDLASLSNLFLNENNPPLFFLITHFAIKLFGTSVWAIRLFPVLFSSLTIFFLIKLVDRHFGKIESLIVGILFTFSNYHFFVSHEARAYGLFGLLLVLSFTYFLKLMNQKSITVFLLLAVFNVLLIYNHFFGFFIPFVQFVSVLFIKSYRHFLLEFIKCGLLTIFLYTPYLYVMFIRLSASSGGTWVQEPQLMDLYYVLWSFCNMPLPTVISLFIVLIGGFFYFFKEKNNDALNFIFISFLLPYFTMFALSFVMPMFISKYLIHVSFPFYILIASLLVRLPVSSIVKLVLSTALCITFMATFKPTENKLEVTKLVKWVKNNKTDDMIVLFVPNYFDIQFFYHYNRGDFNDYKNFDKRIKNKGFYGINSLKELPNDLLLKYKKILYIGSGAHFVDPEMKIKQTLTKNYIPNGMHFYHHDDVTLYLHK